MTWASILDTRSSFDVAVVLISWVAVVLLGLVAANLHIRLQRLERAEWAPSGTTPYRRWLGQHWRDVLGDLDLPEPPRHVLFLSSSCAACARVVDELESGGGRRPTVLVWTDRAPTGLVGRGESAVVLELGPEPGVRLGVRVTPFALVLDDDGRIVKASPFNSLEALDAGREERRAPWPSNAMPARLREVSS